jgi:hyperosmotically inducible periplasmic protein
MNKIILALPVALLIGSGSVGQFSIQNVSADQAGAPTAADNTGKNVRDRNDATLTPTDQSENEVDRTLTQRVRQAVVDDDSLSTNAKNVKIISQNGAVTLRGPVKNEEERKKVVAKAQQIAGEKNVDNQLEIAAN